MTRARLWWASLGGLAVVGASTGGVLIVAGQSAAAAPSIRSSGNPATDVAVGTTVTLPAPSAFRDGRYSATGRYLTPGGDESIRVTVRIRDGLVTETAAETEALSPTARQFQDQFGVHVADRAVGRPLATLSVSAVAGASLTSTGFNNALAQIRMSAQR